MTERPNKEMKLTKPSQNGASQLISSVSRTIEGMTTVYTDADFDQLSWHDCHLWGLRFEIGDSDEDDWTSDFVLDLDFIVEWLVEGNQFRFRVAPARLVFHGVTDPRLTIDWGSSGFQNALHHVSIDAIHRERVAEQKVYLDRPYFSWRVALNWPAGGEIAFGAVGFTQTLLAEPALVSSQHLPRKARAAG